ncbi:MAG TPA: serine hydrolase domain-containing protein [Bradyrhizobium sp.]|nr:serine hydrolase domain-containing protein [Bradyrhizobium sp.]
MGSLATAAVAALLFLSFSAGSLGTALADERFPPADEEALIDIINTGMTAQRQPGLIVGIWIPGRGSLVRAFGTSDLASNAPMQIDDHVRIASITKTFTGVATLQLVDDGRLSLDDVLSNYLEGVDSGNRITIRHLLSMTSGIYDFTSDDEFLKDFTDNPLMSFAPQDVLDILKRHKPDFGPSEKVSYCDTNYILLGMIVEKVTSEPVQTTITEKILKPLGLGHTSFPIAPAIPEPFAHGYYAGEDGKGEFKDYTATNPAVGWTAGAMISTLEDLRAWAKALATGALLTPATHAEQMKFGTITTKPLYVGYGLGIGNFGGLLGHNGAIFGYTTAMFYWPDADAIVVLAGNQASNFSNATTEIAIQLAEHLFPSRIK